MSKTAAVIVMIAIAVSSIAVPAVMHAAESCVCGDGQVLADCAMCGGDGKSSTGNSCQSCGGTGERYVFCSKCGSDGVID